MPEYGIKKDSLIILNLVFQTIFLFIKIKSEVVECPKSTPIYIKSSDNCEIKYCGSKDFSSGECEIKNDLVKTQWLNNIITISSFNFRYINFAKYENGDMVIGISEYPGSITREFYGIKYNGRPLFTKDSNETFYYITEIPEDSNGIFEGEGLIVKANPDGKEYYFYLSKLENYAEMFDLENGNNYCTSSSSFGGNENVFSLRHAIVPLSTSNNDYPYIIAYLVNIGNDNRKLVFRKYNFGLNYMNTPPCFSFYNYDILNTKEKENAIGFIVSCFESENKYIICFYLTKVSEQINWETSQKLYLNLIKYSPDLKDEKSTKFEITLEDEFNFYKCAHLSGDVGIFAYFDYYSDIVRAHLLFKQFNNNQFEDFLPDSDLISNSKLLINSTNLSNHLLINDIIKVSDNNIYFCSTLSNKETIYIVNIKIFGDKKIKLRYYYIPSFKLYNYKILFELRIHIYKNFLAFSSSFCPNETCSADEDEHYAGLILFSYPNGTDYTLDLEKYLFNNNIPINDIQIDLRDYIIIENNLFGYIYDTIFIQNIEGYENLKLFSSINPSEEIVNEKNISQNEKIIIAPINIANNYGLINCKFEYIYNVSNPQLSIYDTYADYIEGDDDTDYYSINQYSGRLNYYNIILKNELSTVCDNNDCALCLRNNKNYCITCKYIYNISKDDNEQYYKICQHEEFTEIMTEKQSDIITEKTTEKIIIINDNECTLDEIINNECTERRMGQNQLIPICDYIKNNYINNNITGESIIIQTKNVLLQLASHEEQKNYNNKNISNIDLLECEGKLRAKYEIPDDCDLIIFKTDIKSIDLTQTYVQYEVYHPIKLIPLDLSICKGVQVSINAPIKLDNSTAYIYENLKKSGYNLFKYNDSFYTDICTVYTSENGTDMLLEDRQKEIFEKSGNKALCQTGCEFLNYDSKIEKAECQCSTQTNETFLVSVNSDNKFIMNVISDSFYTTLKNSNFLVLRCYKVAFDFKTIAKNIGRIFMCITLILNLSLTIIFCFVDFKNINKYLLSILSSSTLNISNFSKKTSKKRKKEKKKRKYKKNISQGKMSLQENNNNIDKKNENNCAPPKKISRGSCNNNKIKIDKLLRKNDGNLTVKSLLVDDNICINRKIDNDKNEVNINIIPINNLNVTSNKNQNNIFNNNNQINISNNNNNNIEKNKILENKIIDEKNINNNNNQINEEKVKETRKNLPIIPKKEKKKYKSMKNLNKKGIQNKNFQMNNLNEYELNNLEYELAIVIDKRTYLQYYWSLLKRKHLILFTFYPINDYNLTTIKITLFLISFSLYMTINGFFFTDETMHNIHESSGSYKILIQIPQIIYSSLVSSVINLILRPLSLSERSLIEIKEENRKEKIESKNKEIIRFLKLKFLIFYILDYLLLFFFWYFISCFCGVYTNTQIILIKDSLISFGISMLYPFGLNLLPGIFRISALRAEKKDKNSLYKISKLLALI